MNNEKSLKKAAKRKQKNTMVVLCTLFVLAGAIVGYLLKDAMISISCIVIASIYLSKYKIF